jgi:1-acyl-sn-glycerol-3-phosphate acyltransferase
MWRRIARLLLRIGGWTAVGDIPSEPKAVFIAAPHTSNWDGFWALTYKVAIGLDVHFFAKKSLFWFPLGSLLRVLGGVPLDRSRATSAVALAIDMFDDEEHFFFGLAPEGTRAYKDGWKSGFYRIAVGANVPVFLGLIDYGKKQVGIGRRLDLTGDQDADLEEIAKYYAGVEGRWPEKATPIRFSK